MSARTNYREWKTRIIDEELLTRAVSRTSVSKFFGENNLQDSSTVQVPQDMKSERMNSRRTKSLSPFRNNRKVSKVRNSSFGRSNLSTTEKAMDSSGSAKVKSSSSRDNNVTYAIPVKHGSARKANIKQSSSKAKLSNKYKGVRRKATFECKYCIMKFTSVTELAKHRQKLEHRILSGGVETEYRLDSHQGLDKSGNCPICNHFYSHIDSLRRHLRHSLVISGKYACAHCKHTFNNDIRRHRHVTIVHSKKSSVENTLSEPSVSQHKDTYNESNIKKQELHVCELCHRGYQSKKSCTRHMKQCQQRMKLGKMLKANRSDHNGMSSQNSKTVNKSKSVKLKSTVDDELSHRQFAINKKIDKMPNTRKIVDLYKEIIEKNGMCYTCTICDYSTENKCNMFRHAKRKHPYCNNCDKVLSTRNIFLTHICNNEDKSDQMNPNDYDGICNESVMYQRDDYWYCSVCDYVTDERSDMLRHVKQTHPYCTVCSKSFSNKDTYSQHISKVHNGIEDLDKCDKSTGDTSSDLGFDWNSDESDENVLYSLNTDDENTSQIETMTDNSLLNESTGNSDMHVPEAEFKSDSVESVSVGKRSSLLEGNIVQLDDNTWKCGMCGKTSLSRCHTKRHLRLVHLFCTTCCRQFKKPLSFRNHLLKIHGMQDHHIQVKPSKRKKHTPERCRKTKVPNSSPKGQELDSSKTDEVDHNKLNKVDKSGTNVEKKSNQSEKREIWEDEHRPSISSTLSMIDTGKSCSVEIIPPNGQVVQGNTTVQSEQASKLVRKYKRLAGKRAPNPRLNITRGMLNIKSEAFNSDESDNEVTFKSKKGILTHDVDTDSEVDVVKVPHEDVNVGMSHNVLDGVNRRQKVGDKWNAKEAQSLAAVERPTPTSKYLSTKSRSCAIEILPQKDVTVTMPFIILNKLDCSKTVNLKMSSSSSGNVQNKPGKISNPTRNVGSNKLRTPLNHSKADSKILETEHEKGDNDKSHDNGDNDKSHEKGDNDKSPENGDNDKSDTCTTESDIGTSTFILGKKLKKFSKKNSAQKLKVKFNEIDSNKARSSMVNDIFQRRKLKGEMNPLNFIVEEKRKKGLRKKSKMESACKSRSDVTSLDHAGSFSANISNDDVVVLADHSSRDQSLVQSHSDPLDGSENILSTQSPNEHDEMLFAKRGRRKERANIVTKVLNLNVESKSHSDREECNVATIKTESVSNKRSRSRSQETPVLDSKHDVYSDNIDVQEKQKNDKRVITLSPVVDSRADVAKTCKMRKNTCSPANAHSKKDINQNFSVNKTSRNDREILQGDCTASSVVEHSKLEDGARKKFEDSGIGKLGIKKDSVDDENQHHQRGNVRRSRRDRSLQDPSRDSSGDSLNRNNSNIIVNSVDDHHVLLCDANSGKVCESEMPNIGEREEKKPASSEKDANSEICATENYIQKEYNDNSPEAVKVKDIKDVKMYSAVTRNYQNYTDELLLQKVPIVKLMRPDRSSSRESVDREFDCRKAKKSGDLISGSPSRRKSGRISAGISSPAKQTKMAAVEYSALTDEKLVECCVNTKQKLVTSVKGDISVEPVSFESDEVDGHPVSDLGYIKGQDPFCSQDGFFYHSEILEDLSFLDNTILDEQFDFLNLDLSNDISVDDIPEMEEKNDRVETFISKACLSARSVDQDLYSLLQLTKSGRCSNGHTALADDSSWSSERSDFSSLAGDETRSKKVEADKNNYEISLEKNFKELHASVLLVRKNKKRAKRGSVKRKIDQQICLKKPAKFLQGIDADLNNRSSELDDVNGKFGMDEKSIDTSISSKASEAECEKNTEELEVITTCLADGLVASTPRRDSSRNERKEGDLKCDSHENDKTLTEEISNDHSIPRLDSSRNERKEGDFQCDSCESDKTLTEEISSNDQVQGQTVKCDNTTVQLQPMYTLNTVVDNSVVHIGTTCYLTDNSEIGEEGDISHQTIDNENSYNQDNGIYANSNNNQVTCSEDNDDLGKSESTMKKEYTQEVCSDELSQSQDQAEINSQSHVEKDGTCFVCNWCGKKYKHKHSLKRHKTKRHGSQITPPKKSRQVLKLKLDGVKGEGQTGSSVTQKENRTNKSEMSTTAHNEEQVKNCVPETKSVTDNSDMSLVVSCIKKNNKFYHKCLICALEYRSFKNLEHHLKACHNVVYTQMKSDNEESQQTNLENSGQLAESTNLTKQISDVSKSDLECEERISSVAESNDEEKYKKEDFNKYVGSCKEEAKDKKKFDLVGNSVSLKEADLKNLVTDIDMADFNETMETECNTSDTLLDSVSLGVNEADDKVNNSESYRSVESVLTSESGCELLTYDKTAAPVKSPASSVETILYEDYSRVVNEGLAMEGQLKPQSSNSPTKSKNKNSNTFLSSEDQELDKQEDKHTVKRKRGRPPKQSKKINESGYLAPKKDNKKEKSESSSKNENIPCSAQEESSIPGELSETLQADNVVMTDFSNKSDELKHDDEYKDESDIEFDGKTSNVVSSSNTAIEKGKSGGTTFEEIFVSYVKATASPVKRRDLGALVAETPDDTETEEDEVTVEPYITETNKCVQDTEETNKQTVLNLPDANRPILESFAVTEQKQLEVENESEVTSSQKGSIQDESKPEEIASSAVLCEKSGQLIVPQELKSITVETSSDITKQISEDVNVRTINKDVLYKIDKVLSSRTANQSEQSSVVGDGESIQSDSVSDVSRIENQSEQSSLVDDGESVQSESASDVHRMDHQSEQSSLVDDVESVQSDYVKDVPVDESNDKSDIFEKLRKTLTGIRVHIVRLPEKKKVFKLGNFKLKRKRYSNRVIWKVKVLKMVETSVENKTSSKETSVNTRLDSDCGLLVNSEQDITNYEGQNAFDKMNSSNISKNDIYNSREGKSSDTLPRHHHKSFKKHRHDKDREKVEKYDQKEKEALSGFDMALQACSKKDSRKKKKKKIFERQLSSDSVERQKNVTQTATENLPAMAITEDHTNQTELNAVEKLAKSESKSKIVQKILREKALEEEKRSSEFDFESTEIAPFEEIIRQTKNTSFRNARSEGMIDMPSKSGEQGQKSKPSNSRPSSTESMNRLKDSSDIIKSVYETSGLKIMKSFRKPKNLSSLENESKDMWRSPLENLQKEPEIRFRWQNDPLRVSSPMSYSDSGAEDEWKNQKEATAKKDSTKMEKKDLLSIFEGLFENINAGPGEKSAQSAQSLKMPGSISSPKKVQFRDTVQTSEMDSDRQGLFGNSRSETPKKRGFLENWTGMGAKITSPLKTPFSSKRKASEDVPGRRIKLPRLSVPSESTSQLSSSSGLLSQKFAEQETKLLDTSENLNIRIVVKNGSNENNPSRKIDVKILDNDNDENVKDNFVTWKTTEKEVAEKVDNVERGESGNVNFDQLTSQENVNEYNLTATDVDKNELEQRLDAEKEEVEEGEPYSEGVDTDGFWQEDEQENAGVNLKEDMAGIGYDDHEELDFEEDLDEVPIEENAGANVEESESEGEINEPGTNIQNDFEQEIKTDHDVDVIFISNEKKSDGVQYVDSIKNEDDDSSFPREGAVISVRENDCSENKEKEEHLDYNMNKEDHCEDKMNNEADDDDSSSDENKNESSDDDDDDDDDKGSDSSNDDHEFHRSAKTRNFDRNNVVIENNNHDIDMKNDEDENFSDDEKLADVISFEADDYEISDMEEEKEEIDKAEGDDNDSTDAEGEEKSEDESDEQERDREKNSSSEDEQNDDEHQPDYVETASVCSSKYSRRSVRSSRSRRSVKYDPDCIQLFVSDEEDASFLHDEGSVILGNSGRISPEENNINSGDEDNSDMDVVDDASLINTKIQMNVPPTQNTLSKYRGFSRSLVPHPYCYFYLMRRCTRVGCKFLHKDLTKEEICRYWSDALDLCLKKKDKIGSLQSYRNLKSLNAQTITADRVGVLYTLAFQTKDPESVFQLCNDMVVHNMFDTRRCEEVISLCRHQPKLYVDQLFYLFRVIERLNLQPSNDSFNVLLSSCADKTDWTKLWCILQYCTQFDSFFPPKSIIQRAIDAVIKYPQKYSDQMMTWVKSCEASKLVILDSEQLKRLSALCETRTLIDELKVGSNKLPEIKFVENGDTDKLRNTEEEMEGARNKDENYKYYRHRIDGCRFTRNWDYLGSIFSELCCLTDINNSSYVDAYVEVLWDKNSPENISVNLNEFITKVGQEFANEKQEDVLAEFDMRSLTLVCNKLLYRCHEQQMWQIGYNVLFVACEKDIPCQKYFIPGKKNIIHTAVEICLNNGAPDDAFKIITGCEWELLNSPSLFSTRELLQLFRQLIVQLIDTQCFKEACKVLAELLTKADTDSKLNFMDTEIDLPKTFDCIISQALKLSDVQMAFNTYQLHRNSRVKKLPVATLRALLASCTDYSMTEQAKDLYEYLRQIPNLYPVQNITEQSNYVLLTNTMTPTEMHFIISDYLHCFYNYLCQKQMDGKLLTVEDLALSVYVKWHSSPLYPACLDHWKHMSLASLLNTVLNILKNKFVAPLIGSINKEKGCIDILPQSLEKYLTLKDEDGRRQGLRFGARKQPLMKPGQHWGRQGRHYRMK